MANDPNITNKIRILIFGTDYGGKMLTDKLMKRYDFFEVLAYVDTYSKSLEEGIYCGKSVIHPKDIGSYQYDAVFIASPDYYWTKKRLAKYGVPEERIKDTMVEDLIGRSARVEALRNVSRMIHKNNVQGAVAELGIFQGNFARHINELFFDREFYLFDTFEGFADEDIDKEIILGSGVTKESHNYSETSVKIVMGNMRNPEKCIVKKGVFPKTAVQTEVQFAFVSLDADLYQPILEGLRYFYPRLSRGGYIFLDDYFNEKFTSVTKAVDEYVKEAGEITLVPIGDGSSIGIEKP